MMQENDYQVCGIYLADCHGHIYVGSSKCIKSRIKNHIKLLKSGKHKSSKWQRAYNKYKSVKFKVLLMCEEKDLIANEQFFIDKLKPDLNHNKIADRINWTPELIEKMANSKRGAKLSEEHKAKVSEFHKGRKRSKETGKRISLALTGKPLSEEHKEKIRKIRIGSKASEETKRKMSASQKGKKMPQEAVEKMRQSQLLRWKIRKEKFPNLRGPNFGRKWSEETKAKMSAAAFRRRA